MDGKTVALTAVSALTLGSAVAAGFTIWLLVAEPIAVATAVVNHDAIPLLETALSILGNFLIGVVRSL